MPKARVNMACTALICFALPSLGVGCAYSHQFAQFESSTLKPCEEIDGLTETEVERRYKLIREFLGADVEERRAWLGVWTSLLGLGTVGQAVGAGIVDTRSTRVALIGGAVSTASAVAATIAFHPIPLDVASELDPLPADSLEAKRARLCRAETMFHASAAREVDGLAMKGRIIADLFGLVGGVLGIAFGDVPVGIGTIVGSAGGYEIQAATRPSRSLAGWLDYIGDHTLTEKASATPVLSTPTSWNVGIAPQQFSMGVNF